LRQKEFIMPVLKTILRILPLLYMVAIFIMSSMSSDAIVELPDSGLDNFIKESLHLVEFGILYMLLALATLTFKSLTFKINLILMIIASLYGLSDEIHQSFIPERSATVIDLVKDVIGVLVASWILYGAYIGKRFEKLGKALHLIEKSRR
jgi:VanZ family protein